MLQRHAALCHVWAVMPTHYHLAIEPSATNLDVLMRDVNSWFARIYNSRVDRRGYLFFSRYKSLAVLSLRYMRELVRYIHLNPIRAGLVDSLESLDDYPWTSHFDVMHRCRYSWFSRSGVLNLFGAPHEDALANYRAFLAQGLEVELAPGAESDVHDSEQPEVAIFDRRILSTGPTGSGPTTTPEAYVTDFSSLQWGRTIESVASEVCDRFCGLSIEDLRRRSRDSDVSRARAQLAHACMARYRFSVYEVASFLGTTPSGASRAAKRGAHLARTPLPAKSHGRPRLVA
jgi:hypothetical protein